MTLQVIVTGMRSPANSWINESGFSLVAPGPNDLGGRPRLMRDPFETGADLRRYRVTTFRRFVFIGMLQDAELTLADIAEILNAADVSEWKAIATRRFEALDEKPPPCFRPVRTFPVRCSVVVTIRQRTARSWESSAMMRRNGSSACAMGPLRMRELKHGGHGSLRG